jgi:hypothetical protein
MGTFEREIGPWGMIACPQFTQLLVQDKWWLTDIAVRKPHAFKPGRKRCPLSSCLRSLHVLYSLVEQTFH